MLASGDHHPFRLDDLPKPIGFVQETEIRGSMLKGKELFVKSSLEGETFVELKQAA
jgi:hypothetical protein